jgi:hypothetical protein
MWTILSASGPFSIACVARVDSILSKYGPLPAARGPFILCYGRTSVPRTRTVFIHQDPELTFLLTRASLHHSLRERTIFYCLISTRGQYPIKHTDLCSPRWTFLVRADLLSVMGGCMSLARGPFSFIRTPGGLFCSLALRMRIILSASGPFSIACA